MCKRIFQIELKLSSYWQNIKFSRYRPKFHTFTNIVIFQVYLFFFKYIRPTAYKFYGRDMSGILFFIFASCEPISLLWWYRSRISFEIKASEQRHRLLSLACSPLHYIRPGPVYIRLRSTQIWIQTFCYYLNNDKAILSQFHYKQPPSLVTNSQRKATSIVQSFVFCGTIHHYINRGGI